MNKAYEALELMDTKELEFLNNMEIILKIRI